MFEKIEKLNNKQKLLISVAIGILSAYYCYDSTYIPAETQYKVVQEENERLKKEIIDTNNFIDANPNIDDELVKADFGLKSLLFMLPKDRDIDTILANLNSRAKDTGVEILEFSPDTTSSVGSIPNAPTVKEAQPPIAPPPTAPPDPNAPPTDPNAPLTAVTPPQNQSEFQSFTIKVAVQGNYGQIVSFLDKAMDMPRIVSVQEVEMSPLQSDPLKIKDSPQLKVSVLLNSYYQPLAGLGI